MHPGLAPPSLLRTLFVALCAMTWCAAPARSADPARRTFAVPAGEAARTLKLFAAQAGREILFPAEPLAALRTHAIKGDFTPLAALTRMVAGAPVIVLEDPATGALLVKLAPLAPRSPPTTAPPATSSTSSAPSPSVKKTSLLSAFGALAAFLIQPLPAQTAKPAVAAEKNDEIITLSEFEVSAKDDGSYMPSESTTGSRVNAKVKDLPYAVSTMTSEFMRDFSIFELTEELSYMSAVTGVDAGGNLNLRGFNGGTNNLRNGLASNGLIDAASVDRIEVIKGPAAAIYGQTSPSGAMVVTTKSPSARAKQSLSFTAGSYSLVQVKAGGSGPLWSGSGNPKLFYRVDLQYYHRLFDSPGVSTLTRSVTLPITYKPGPNTTVTVEGAYLLGQGNYNAPGAIPYLFNSATGRYTGGYAMNLAKKVITSPADYRNRWNGVFGGNVQHRFNSIFSGKIAATTTHRTLVPYISLGGDRYDPALNRITNGRTSISYAKTDYDYRNAALDLTAAGYRFLGARHRTLLTIDHSFQNQATWNTTSTPEFNAAHPQLANTRKEVDTDYSLVARQPVTVGAGGGPAFLPLTYARDSYVATTGLFVRQEATLLRDHLILTAGYRHDRISADLREPALNYRREVADRNDTMLLGLTYRITPTYSWYLSRNESFQPFGTGTSANPANAIAQPTTGLGYETGLKGELLDGRLNFTLTSYRTDRKNQQVTERDEETGILTTSYLGATETRGTELDVNYRLLNGLQALVSYANTHAILAHAGRDTDAAGRQTRGTPNHSFSTALRYQARPALSLTLGVRYVSASPADNPNAGATFSSTTGLFVNHNGLRDVWVPSSAIWTAGGTYTWQSRRYTKLGHSVTVTAKNLFDKLYIIPGNNRALGDRLGVYATYTLTR